MIKNHEKVISISMKEFLDLIGKVAARMSHCKQVIEMFGNLNAQDIGKIAAFGSLLTIELYEIGDSEVIEDAKALQN